MQYQRQGIQLLIILLQMNLHLVDYGNHLPKIIYLLKDIFNLHMVL